jgi:hypothetical protein
VLQICGCEIAGTDVDRLLELLDADVTLVSDEAAGAIRFARNSGVTIIDRLDAGIGDVIKHVLLRGPLPAGLARLRDELDRGCF